MTRRIQITPGKHVVAQAKAGIVVASLFLVFGLVVAVVLGMETPRSEPGLMVVQIGFLLIWIAACVSVIVRCARLLSKQAGDPENSLLEVHVSGGGEEAETGQGDFEARLRKLEKLKQDGLITDEEHAAKRREILKDKW